MKMSDVFEGFVRVESDPFSEYARFPLFDNKGVVLAAWNERYAGHVSHAINNHDKLVEALEGLINDISINHSIHDGNMIGGSTREVLAQAHQALKQAKGE